MSALERSARLPRIQVNQSGDVPSRVTSATAVVFDSGDVLYDATTWWRWLVQLLGRMGLHTHFESLHCVWRREFLRDVNTGKREYREAFREFLRAVGMNTGQIDETEVSCWPRYESMSVPTRSLVGVGPTLSKLRSSGFKLAVYSHAPHSTARMQEILESLGILGLFDFVVSSTELGYLADDPRGYVEVAKSIDVAPRQVAYVSHATDELDGAAAADMDVVAYNYDLDARAHVFLARFDQLNDVIQPARVARQAG